MRKVTAVPDLLAPPAFVVRSWHQRERVVADISGESMTHQSFAEECDINRILRRYSETGYLPPSDGRGVFADVTALQRDFTTAINESNAVIQDANVKVKERRKKAKEDADAQAKKDAEDLAAFRAKQKDLLATTSTT